MYNIFNYICLMTVKEFLKTNKLINLSAVAKLMYPTNSDAPAYLLRKLSDGATRPFTVKDSEKALEILKQLSVSVSGITID